MITILCYLTVDSFSEFYLCCLPVALLCKENFFSVILIKHKDISYSLETGIQNKIPNVFQILLEARPKQNVYNKIFYSGIF